jgi:hypothetical protein
VHLPYLPPPLDERDEAALHHPRRALLRPREEEQERVPPPLLVELFLRVQLRRPSSRASLQHRRRSTAPSSELLALVPAPAPNHGHLVPPSVGALYSGGGGGAL